MKASGKRVFVGGKEERVLEEAPIVDEECDREFIRKIIGFGGGDVQVCLQCGNCTGVCAVSMKTENKVRNIIKMCQMGLREKVLSTPWVCATCYRCYEHCPAAMNPAELIIALRHITVRELGPPPFVVAASRNVASLGQTVEVEEATLEARREVGLAAEPFEKSHRDKAVRDIRAIMRATGFDRLIGIDLED